MDLTPENQAHIDQQTLEQLLAYVRFAHAGDKWMTGETGAYWLVRLRDLRVADGAAFIEASKRIGWAETQSFENN
jgi:hypothetical protein